MRNLVDILKKALKSSRRQEDKETIRALFEGAAQLRPRSVMAALTEDERVGLGLAFSKDIYCDLTWTGSGKTASIELLESLEADCKATLLNASKPGCLDLAPVKLDAEMHERLLIRACTEAPWLIAPILRLRQKTSSTVSYNSEAFIDAVQELTKEDYLRLLLGAGWLRENDLPFAVRPESREGWKRRQTDHLYTAKYRLEVFRRASMVHSREAKDLEVDERPGAIEDRLFTKPRPSKLRLVAEYDRERMRQMNNAFSQPKPASWSVTLSDHRRLVPAPPSPSPEEEQYDATNNLGSTESWCDGFRGASGPEILD